MSLILVGGALALPTQSDAWVAYGRAGWGRCCWHTGYCCGGVSTGTSVAVGCTGLAVGARVIPVATPTVVVSTPAYPAPYYYSDPPVVVPPVAPVGSIYYSLPAGAQAANINGIQYYVLGSTYFRPFFGSNGVYYEVVPNPI